MDRPKKLQTKLKRLINSVESNLELGRQVTRTDLETLTYYSEYNAEVSALLGRVRSRAKTPSYSARGAPSSSSPLNRKLTKREKRLLKKDAHIVVTSRAPEGRARNLSEFQNLVAKARNLLSDGHAVPQQVWRGLKESAGDDGTCKRILKNLRSAVPNVQPRLESVQWQLLPPESGLRSLVRTALESRARNGSASVDTRRIEFMLNLKPDRIAVGRDSFGDYAAFIFSDRKLAVLESPIEGNATYILRGDWRELSRETKHRLTVEIGEPVVERVVHRGD